MATASTATPGIARIQNVIGPMMFVIEDPQQ